VNKQITRVAVAAVVLVAALIVATTYWQTWASAGLSTRQDNAIQRVAQFTIKRGPIKTADGVLLAANRVKEIQGKTFYFRRYPVPYLAPHVVGYSTQSHAQAGLERSENAYLTGSNANLSTVFRTTMDRLKGVTVKGNGLVLTLNSKAQKVADDGLAGKCGAAVALDPATGKVLVMASSPPYNPNQVEKDFVHIGITKAACSGAAPLLNRATDGLFTPGSTFKVITAAAALDTGKFTPESRFNDPGYCEEYGKRVSNAGNPDQNGPEAFGNVTLAQGLQHSINSVFCNVGKQIGAGLILDYAKRFGFYSIPPLETPRNERAPSGLFNRAKLYDPKHPEFQVDPGRLAFGQERMLTTPLQMAMVAATVANNGTVMRPYIVDRVVDPGGKKTVEKFHPHKLGQAIKPETAAALNTMMQAVMTGGTGTSDQIPGIKTAGKTGTAETGIAGVNTTWFIAFAPADAPKVAVAVALENQHGYGATTAGPIAKAIMEALLHLPSK
jgi:peptidoglycan glycosyltransferase